MKALVVALSFLVLPGCFCASPWSKFPRKEAPDVSYSLGGGTHGFDVYVWSCLGGEKVVVYQYTAEMSCRAAEREVAPCGGETAFERAHRDEPRQPARTSRAWR